MKVLLVALILCLSSFLRAQEIDILHYKYELQLNDKNDSVYGKATIQFIFKREPVVAAFDLITLKGIDVDSAFLDRRNLLQLGPGYEFLHDENKVLLPIAQDPFHPPYRKGDTANAYISYKGVPSDGLIISKNKYGDKTFFADNWPNRAHHWLPCIDRPDDKASFEFTVHAPTQYNVISNGIRVEEKEEGHGIKLTHWKEDTPSPTKVMVIGVAKFATKIYEDSPKDIPVSAWMYPQDSTKGFYDYAVAPSILKFFADYIGPFPYKKLANVQSKTIFGGMENASCIFYNEDYITGKRQHEDVIAHEIAHQWFGDAVTEKSFAHLWLSEGFANYFENFYFEKKYGEEVARKKLEGAREEVIAFAKQSDHPVVDSTKDLMSLLNTNSYQKGAWVLRMLRFEVGDSVFQKIIQTYYQQYKHGNAETRDFEAIAEQVSGKELSWFFDQWLYQNAVPKLRIKKSLIQKGVQITIEQLQEDVFQFTLPIAIETLTTKGKTGHFKISKRTETLFISKDKTSKLSIDPYCQLLYEDVK